MFHHYQHFIAGVIAVGLFSVSHAQFVAIAEDFSTAGNLSGSTPDSGLGNWTTIGGTGAITVSSGSASLSGTAAGEASQLNFSASNLSTGTIYLGFDLIVSDTAGMTPVNTVQSIAGFRAGTPGTGSYTVGFGVFRPSNDARTNSGAPDTSTGQVDFGLFTGTSQNAATSVLTTWGTALDRGAAYRVVIGFDLGNDSASLWVDPVSADSTAVTLTGVTADSRGIFLRQGNASSGDQLIDNLVVTQDFQSAATVPEPATCAFFGGLATLGFVCLRRFWARRRRSGRP